MDQPAGFFLSHLGIHCIDGISRATLSVRRKSWRDVLYVQLPQHYLLAGRFVKMLHLQILEQINSFRFFCWFWWRIQKFSSSHLNIPFLNARIQPTRRWWVCQFFPFSVVFACSWLSSFGQSSNILSRPGDRTKRTCCLICCFIKWEFWILFALILGVVIHWFILNTLCELKPPASQNVL